MKRKVRNTAAKGRRKEHQVRDHFKALGYTVVRAAGSLGPIDLVALPPPLKPLDFQLNPGEFEKWMAGQQPKDVGDREPEPLTIEDMNKMWSNKPYRPGMVVAIQVKPSKIYKADKKKLEDLRKKISLEVSIEGWVVEDGKKPYRQFAL